MIINTLIIKVYSIKAKKTKENSFVFNLLLSSLIIGRDLFKQKYNYEA